MDTIDPHDLANSMIRMYGPVTAFSLADRYATECTAGGDTSGHSKWVATALVIRAKIEQAQKSGP
jgi:hypothetical protein